MIVISQNIIFLILDDTKTVEFKQMHIVCSVNIHAIVYHETSILLLPYNLKK